MSYKNTYNNFDLFFDDLVGNHYITFTTSLNRLLYFYFLKQTNSNYLVFSIDDYLNNHSNHISNQSFTEYLFSLRLSKEKRRIMKLNKKRVVFLIENKKDILKKLLSKTNYKSIEDIEETIVEIYSWLKKFRQDNSEIELESWLSELKPICDDIEYKKKPREKNKSSILNNSPISNQIKIEYFWQLFKGKDDDEKKQKFDKIDRIFVIQLLDYHNRRNEQI